MAQRDCGTIVPYTIGHDALNLTDSCRRRVLGSVIRYQLFTAVSARGHDARIAFGIFLMDAQKIPGEDRGCDMWASLDMILPTQVRHDFEAGLKGVPSTMLVCDKVSETWHEHLRCSEHEHPAFAYLFAIPDHSIKTRLQAAQGFAKAGGFGGIYKGVGSVILAISLIPALQRDRHGVCFDRLAAAFFCTYDTLKRTLPVPAHLAPVNHMISASMGEIAACLIRVPTEVIKTRSQTSSYGALADSSLAAAKLLWKTEGLRGFYRGFGITVMREIPFTSLQFPMYELFKTRLSHFLYGRPASLHAYEAALCGSVAGGIAAALTTPLDVVKTRVMLDLRDPSHASYPSPAVRLRQIYATEGLRALFSGGVPRTMWISAGGAVFLGVYEWIIGSLVPSSIDEA
ncbi:hypothetical protein EW146_g6614 [Bondarzewia mesenterica]|uniref:Uncharacterized protein n=1 Tax=Bondarzewia mesenterica TaxID=1095465 RepID=A0A4S4LP01_9AGAM|nr:hypothetical protein EW146_g6614 [Bondarzewia mesenterica]